MAQKQAQAQTVVVHVHTDKKRPKKKGKGRKRAAVPQPQTIAMPHQAPPIISFNPGAVLQSPQVVPTRPELAPLTPPPISSRTPPYSFQNVHIPPFRSTPFKEPEPPPPVKVEKPVKIDLAQFAPKKDEHGYTSSEEGTPRHLWKPAQVILPERHAPAEPEIIPERHHKEPEIQPVIERKPKVVPGFQDKGEIMPHGQALGVEYVPGIPFFSGNQHKTKEQMLQDFMEKHNEKAADMPQDEGHRMQVMGHPAAHPGKKYGARR